MAKKNEDKATQEFDERQEGKENSAALESLSVLADRHRVPTWQQAGLCRFMNWADGKMVSDTDYVSALEKLKTRRVGGGRMG